MSTYDPDRRPRTASGDAGGRWIVGIIVVVLIGLGVWWWAGTGTGGAGPRSANTNAPAPASTIGAAPSRTTPPAAPSGAAK